MVAITADNATHTNDFIRVIPESRTKKSAYTAENENAVNNKKVENLATENVVTNSTNSAKER